MVWIGIKFIASPLLLLKFFKTLEGIFGGGKKSLQLTSELKDSKYHLFLT